jgi:catechol 2,3-dioxygenase-like lactoylglutathione lyase family enzyme
VSVDRMQLRGVSHLALNSSDMARTVEFYDGVLGIPLVKTMELPNGIGQHFFFDIGNGDCLAFFYWANGSGGGEGVAYPENYKVPSTDGGMHHIALAIAPEDVRPTYDRLVAKGVDFEFVAHHLERPSGHSLDDIADDTYAASFYMKDPDGIVVEFCAWLPAWDQVVNAHQAWTGRQPAAVS